MKAKEDGKMTINELRERRMAAIKACRQFLDTRRNERGTLSAEDDATYNRALQELEDTRNKMEACSCY